MAVNVYLQSKICAMEDDDLSALAEQDHLMNFHPDENDLLRIYQKDITSFVPLDQQEILRLIPKAKKGDQYATDRITNSVLRLVFKIAGEYYRKNTHNSLPDLIQVGNEGVLKAIQKYKAKKGTRFTSYAAYWIRAEIFNSLREQRYPMSVPSYVSTVSNKIDRSKEKELTEQQAIASLSRKLKRTPATIRRVYRLKDISFFSLDATATSSDDESKQNHDLVADPRSADLFELTERKMLRERIITIIERKFRVKKKHRTYLKIFSSRRLYGPGEKSITLKTLGKKFSVSDERIRQIEKEIMRELKKDLALRNLFNALVKLSSIKTE